MLTSLAQQLKRWISTTVKVPLAGKGATFDYVVIGTEAGGTAAKLVGSVAIVAIVFAIVIGAAHYLYRPYKTEDITASSTFFSEKQPHAPAAASAHTLRPSAPAQASATEGAASPRRQLVQLDPGLLVFGVVYGQSGDPLAGAAVTLDNEETVAFFKKTLGVRNDVSAVVPVLSSTTSESDGTFSFSRIPVPNNDSYNLLRLRARSNSLLGIQCFFSEPGMKKKYVELSLSATASIIGRVVDDAGAPISGVRVRVTLMPQSNERNPVVSAVEMLSAGDGSFLVSDVPPGSYRFDCTRDGYAVALLDQAIQCGQQNVTIHMTKGCSVKGRVIEAVGGQAVAGIIVSIGYANGESDSTGSFSVAGVSPGEQTVNISNKKDAMLAGVPSYVQASQLCIDVPPHADVRNVTIRVIKGATISGTVYDAETYQPVSDSWVEFFQESGCRMPDTRTDSDGRYGPLGGFEAKRYKVQCHYGADMRVAAESVITVPSPGVNEHVDIPVHCLFVKGQVVDGQNTPVSGASVVASSHSMKAYDQSDSLGRFLIAISGQMREDLYLQAYGESAASRLVGPVLPEDSYTLQLQESGRIDGIVVTRSGAPVRRCWVTAVPPQSDMVSIVVPGSLDNAFEGSRDRTWVTTSETGHFILDPVLPGKYRLEIYCLSSVSGFPLATASADVRPEETLHTRLVVDLSEFGIIEGIVTEDGEPPASATVVLTSTDWLSPMTTSTDPDGTYRFENVRSGNVSVEGIVQSRRKPALIKSQSVHLEPGETKTVDFHFDRSLSGIEGYVTANRQAVVGTSVTAKSQEASSASIAQASTGDNGFYHITGLDKNRYELTVLDPRSKMWRAPVVVEVAEGENTRHDFDLSGGLVEGSFAGLKKGEQAFVAIIDGTTELDALAALGPELEQRVVYQSYITENGPFQLPSVPPGQYYLGVVAYPIGPLDDTTLLTSVTRGRYVLFQVNIKADQTIPFDINIPN